jgi:hypothetical protein
LKHATQNLLYAHFSPDNRWASFTARVAANRGHLNIAPIDGARPIPESAWITIAKEGIDDWIEWSPNGKILYFTSRRDGHWCLWAQRVDAISHRPVGVAFAALHMHTRASYYRGGFSLSGGRIVIVLREDTGDIWMLSPPDKE